MVVAIIPAFNEEARVGEVVRQTRPFVDRVIVVNDGSSDRTSEMAQAAGATVVSHPINRGLGASLGTGFEAGRMLEADVLVTLDADGQHLPHEIPPFIEAIKNGHEAVIGSRMLKREGNMPFKRRVYQRIGNTLTYILFGLWVSDSQSGFRAFSRRGLEEIDIRTNRMEVSSEIVSEIRRRGLKWTEVPITAVYTDYSLSKGQSFAVGVRTAYKLIVHRLKS